MPPGDESDRRRQPEHLPVDLRHLGILDEKVPPEASPQQADQPRSAVEWPEIAFRLLQHAARVGGQGPLAHLLV